MVETSRSSGPVREPVAAAGDSTFPAWLGGGALVLGAALLVADFVVARALVTMQAYEGPAGLFTVVTHPLWVPSRLVHTGALLVLAVGIGYLLAALYDREPVVVGAAGAALGLSVVLYVLELVVATVAAPSLFARPLGTGLSQEQAQVLAMGYQSLAAGLLAVAFLLLGASVVLVGLALYRTGRSRPVLAAAGVVVGASVMVEGISHLVEIPVGGPVALLFFALTVLWFLAFGVTVLGVAPLAE